MASLFRVFSDVKDTQNMSGGEEATKYNSALYMTLKALLNIKILKEELLHIIGQLFHEDDLEDEEFLEKLYNYLLSDLLSSKEEPHCTSIDCNEVFVSILEFWHSFKSDPEEESLVTCLFTLEEYETMTCFGCKRKPNYPEQSSYGIVSSADSIRDIKCAFGNIKFEDILKVIQMEYKMLCDIKTGGCGKTNIVQLIISRCPPIFPIVMEWEKNETEENISKTTKALECEIDMSCLYKGLEENTKYRLVSMVGCGEEEEHICLAYKKNRWISLKHDALAEEEVGDDWESMVRFCGERKVRLKILFYEAAQSIA